MARKLAKFDDRTNVTAHPYGVNTPGGFLMVFSLVYPLTIKYVAAWKSTSVSRAARSFRGNDIATLSSRCRVDGVGVDAAIQDERAVNLISTQVLIGSRAGRRDGVQC